MIKNKSGFTLIELSIVIMLFAIVTLLVSAHASFLQRMMVRCELENLYTTCYMLQRRAMMSGIPIKLTFDQTMPGYQYGETQYALPQYVIFGAAAGVKGPPSSAQNIINSPITFKEQTIIFHPDGIMQPGTVYLTDSGKCWSYALSCAVGQVSYLRKYQYTNAWTLL